MKSINLSLNFRNHLIDRIPFDVPVLVIDAEAYTTGDTKGDLSLAFRGGVNEVAPDAPAAPRVYHCYTSDIENNHKVGGYHTPGFERGVTPDNRSIYVDDNYSENFTSDNWYSDDFLKQKILWCLYSEATQFLNQVDIFFDNNEVRRTPELPIKEQAHIFGKPGYYIEEVLGINKYSDLMVQQTFLNFRTSKKGLVERLRGVFGGLDNYEHSEFTNLKKGKEVAVYKNIYTFKVKGRGTVIMTAYSNQKKAIVRIINLGE